MFVDGPPEILYTTISIGYYSIQMKVSSKTDYALRTLLDLGLHYGEGVIPLGDMARRQAIPKRFLEQILILLKSAGMVNSARGMKGGYTLSRKPSEISLASIVAVTEQGLITRENRLKGQWSGTESVNEQPMREIWDEISDDVWQKLENRTIEDLCRRVKELSASRVPDYAI